MARNKKKLSYRATGGDETIVLMNQPKNVSEGIANHFTVLIENKLSSRPARIALIPANFDTKAVVNGKLAYNSIDEINKAGYNVEAVLCEGAFTNTVNEVVTADVAMQAADPARTIRHFLDYIKLNPIKLKNLEIVSDDANMFDTNMVLTFVNPFFKDQEQSIDLSTFYDLYQEATDRIRLDFTGNEVELSDISLLMAVIPPACKGKFIFRF
ncbi:hypothetical protein LJC53_05550 [Bacteroidales bacterium OttesenSCG-928-C03]|nr:hypothetical protein [Bacteroidales bacterium OttesenSCG-928-C03]MDL2326743.1 hypothetical protein [Bacteroidales bacterium OttesenSCG-928-A14]